MAEKWPVIDLTGNISSEKLVIHLKVIMYQEDLHPLATQPHIKQGDLRHNILKVVPIINCSSAVFVDNFRNFSTN